MSSLCTSTQHNNKDSTPPDKITPSSPSSPSAPDSATSPPGWRVSPRTGGCSTPWSPQRSSTSGWTASQAPFFLLLVKRLFHTSDGVRRITAEICLSHPQRQQLLSKDFLSRYNLTASFLHRKVTFSWPPQILICITIKLFDILLLEIFSLIWEWPVSDWIGWD